ncbi:MAG: WG repeat-containing protein [Bacteroidota bacterium]
MKRLCLAIGLLAYLGNADAFSYSQLASLESKNEPARILKFNQQATSNQSIGNKSLSEPTKIVLDPTKNANAVTCFNNKSGIGLSQSKDLDGRDILAFPLERLRNNVRYGFVENYKQGLARIKKDGVWGYLNLCGDEIIACQYEKAEAFNDGKALVKRQAWHFVDNLGIESDELQNIVEAKSISKGFTLVKLKSNQMALIDNNYDKTNKVVSSLYDDIVILNSTTLGVKTNLKWGIFKLGEGTVSEANYDLVEPSGKENLFKVYQNKKVGLINVNGEIVWKPDFNIITDVDNFGFVKGISDAKQQLINVNDFRVSKIYKKISDFDARGLGIIQGENNLFGLVDKDLKTVIDPQFNTIGAIGEFDLVPVSKEIEGKGLKHGFINLKGLEIIPLEYESVGKINKKGLLVVKEIVSCNLDEKGKRIGTCKADKVIDVNGSTVILPITKYPDAGKINYTVTDSMVHNCIVVRAYRNEDKNKNVKFMLVRGDDFKVITPEPFDFVQAVSKHQFFFIRQNGLWGTLDTTGKYLAKCQFKTILRSSEDYYLVQHDNGKYGYLDARGKVQVTPDYSMLEYFKNGFAIASKGENQMGLINKFNAKIVPFVFKDVKYIDLTKEYEVLDKYNNRYVLNQQGECTQNCKELEAIRIKANGAE